MSGEKDNFKNLKVSRKDFMKLMGAGSLFVGLGAFAIPNIIKSIREASALMKSAQGANATNSNVTNMTSPTISMRIFVRFV
jgi:Ni,Fe-hydrogenase I small subunit